MVSNWEREAREKLRKQAETGCINHIAQKNIPDNDKDKDLANCLINIYQTSDEDLKRIHDQCELTDKNPEKVGQCIGAKFTPSSQVAPSSQPATPSPSSDDSILGQTAKCEEEAKKFRTIKGQKEFKTWCYAGISTKEMGSQTATSIAPRPSSAPPEPALFYAPGRPSPSPGRPAILGGYWTWDNFVNQLVGFVNEYYNYLPSTTPEKEMQAQVLEALKTGALTLPTTTVMRNYGRADITTAMKKFGGLKEVIRKLGIPYTPSQKEKGYWQDWDTFLTELLQFINSLTNYLPADASADELRVALIPALQAGTIAFPTRHDFEGNSRGDLLQAFKHFGGVTGVINKLQLQPQTKYTPPTKPPGFWQDWDNFVNELVIFINQVYDFLPPTTPQKELRDKILKALREGTLDFDTNLIDKYKRRDLRTAITRFWGGIFAVKEKLQMKASRKPRDYWSNWDNFLKELLDYVSKLNHIDPQLNLTQDEILAQLKSGKLQFPSKNDIEGISKSPAGQFSSLNNGFQYFGGINVVREKLGIPPPSAKARGFWEDWDNIVNGVMLFINEFYDYLPSSTPQAEIRTKILEALQNKRIAFPGKNKFEEGGSGNLAHAIERHYGGFANFKAKLNIPIFYLDDPFSRASKMQYYAVRGQKTEDIVVDLIKDWADQNGFSYTTRTPTGTGILEFVCGENKKYGVDVTNAKNLDTIRVKWKGRDYHKFLDELWIIVVADHPPEVIKSLNEEAPENVLVIGYRQLVSFLNGISTSNIPFDIPPEKQRKLDALARCTFSNREQIMKRYKEGEVFKSI
jgi:hypothetical protein